MHFRDARLSHSAGPIRLRSPTRRHGRPALLRVIAAAAEFSVPVHVCERAGSARDPSGEMKQNLSSPHLALTFAF